MSSATKRARQAIAGNAKTTGLVRHDARRANAIKNTTELRQALACFTAGEVAALATKLSPGRAPGAGDIFKAKAKALPGALW